MLLLRLILIQPHTNSLTQPLLPLSNFLHLDPPLHRHFPLLIRSISLSNLNTPTYPSRTPVQSNPFHSSLNFRTRASAVPASSGRGCACHRPCRRVISGPTSSMPPIVSRAKRSPRGQRAASSMMCAMPPSRANQTCVRHCLVS